MIRKIAWLALFLAYFCSSAVAADTLPLEYFIKHGDNQNVKISPDGEYFAVRVRQDGQIVLAFIRRKDMKVTGGARPLNDGDILEVTWVNDERVVYTLTKDFGYADQPSNTGELYGVNRDSSRHEIIFGQGAINERASKLQRKKRTIGDHEIISLMPDDEKYILITVYPWKVVNGYAYTNPDALPEVVRLNVYDGRQRPLERLPLPASRAIADNEGELRFNIGRDKEGKTQIKSYDPDEKIWSDFSTATDLSGTVYPLAFNQDSNMLYVSNTQGEQKTDAISRINVETGAIETLYHEPAHDYFQRYSHPLSREPVFVRTSAGKASYDYLKNPNSKLARLHRTLVNAFKGQAVEITSLTEDLSEAVIFVHSDTNPGEFFLFNTETNKASFIMAANSWVDPRRLRPSEPFSLNTDDGLTLHGFVTKPEGEGPFPMVVLPHGGPHGVLDVWGYDSEIQLLAHHGYAVLQVNFRGSGGYGNRFLEAGHLEWGGKMQDDVTTATRWAVEQGIADAQRLCIFGGSYGGYAALMGVVREPDLYRCAIGLAGVYDLPLMFDKGDILIGRSGEAYLKQVLGEDRQLMKERSPVHQVDKIQVPVLLVHGGEDRRVPIAHGEAMRDALKQANKSVEWLAFEREGHGVYQEENRAKFYGRLLEFLNEHTAPQP